MAAHAGEKARKTGTFHYERCKEKVRVKAGDTIPECPNCGNKTYGERTQEPANKG